MSVLLEMLGPGRCCSKLASSSRTIVVAWWEQPQAGHVSWMQPRHAQRKPSLIKYMCSCAISYGCKRPSSARAREFGKSR